jgi:hypothetical protein
LIDILNDSLKKENKVLNFIISREDIIRKLSMKNILSALQPRRSKKRVIDDSDSDDDGDGATVDEAAAKCSEVSEEKDSTPGDVAEEMEESLDDIKRRHGIDPRALREMNDGLEKESRFRHPLLAHERSNAWEKEKEEGERAQAIAASALANAQFSAGLMGYDAGFVSNCTSEGEAYLKRGSSFSGSSSGCGRGGMISSGAEKRGKNDQGKVSQSQAQNTVYRAGTISKGSSTQYEHAGQEEVWSGGTGIATSGHNADLEQSWEVKVRQRISTSYLLMAPMSVRVIGKVKFRPVGAEDTSLFSFEVPIEVHASSLASGTSVLVDCVFDAVLQQLLDAAPTTHDNVTCPHVLNIENGNGGRLHLRSGALNYSCPPMELTSSQHLNTQESPCSWRPLSRPPALAEWRSVAWTASLTSLHSEQ